MSTLTLLRYQPSFIDQRRRSSSGSSNSSNDSNSSQNVVPSSILLYRDSLKYHESLYNDKMNEIDRLNKLINNLKDNDLYFKNTLEQWLNQANNELSTLKNKINQLQKN